VDSRGSKDASRRLATARSDQWGAARSLAAARRERWAAVISRRLATARARAVGHNSLQEGCQGRPTRLQGPRRRWRHRSRLVMLGVDRSTHVTCLRTLASRRTPQPELTSCSRRSGNARLGHILFVQEHRYSDHDYFLVCQFAFLYYNLVFFVLKLKNKKLIIKLKNNSPKSNRGGTIGSRFEIISLISLVIFLLDLIKFYQKIK
jgi:hypothetical protein